MWLAVVCACACNQRDNSACAQTRYRRGYLYVISWVSKKAFYTWLFVALFTTVQANWAAALVHVKSLVVKSGLL